MSRGEALRELCDWRGCIIHIDLTRRRTRSLHAIAVRRSLAVKLTLLPMLASAAAAAQPATSDEPPLQPPGATEPMLSPPGLTPTIDDCRLVPEDPRCPPVDDEPPVTGYGSYAHGVFVGHIRDHHHHHERGVFRGGFGHYFWASGG